jgi:hypothetical protein
MKLPDHPKPILKRFLASAIFWGAVVLLFMLLSCQKERIPLTWTCMESTEVVQGGKITDRHTDITFHELNVANSVILRYEAENNFKQTVYRNGLEVVTTKETHCYK